VVTSLLVAGGMSVVLLLQWRSGLHYAPARGRAWLVATILILDDRCSKVNGPRCMAAYLVYGPR
jgi:hypothetical protein